MQISGVEVKGDPGVSSALPTLVSLREFSDKRVLHQTLTDTRAAGHRGTGAEWDTGGLGLVQDPMSQAVLLRA